ncbi:hypothetical protein MPTK1_1g20570 [Marchantia polymorpha subsp. ruderalis]|uniref:Uncharacterized protein n=2 Tax=Marchantia polymorpha TaxID=3197 RepID=A0AAF6ASB9_MARPO|nr:hypothetical protein MARPO_0001s0393 [Marchantia polymorpha]BBM99339.1 hypothetical protein Mp_1g20570 [Marchantia polymorpha subsp. ruderalis]|eukprot:PTQ50421.1 hypothetical protein MARPO_0001s0393 [Marchantia polymorpha]
MHLSAGEKPLSVKASWFTRRTSSSYASACSMRSEEARWKWSGFMHECWDGLGRHFLADSPSWRTLEPWPSTAGNSITSTTAFHDAQEPILSLFRHWGLDRRNLRSTRMAPMPLNFPEASGERAARRGSATRTIVRPFNTRIVLEQRSE